MAPVLRETALASSGQPRRQGLAAAVHRGARIGDWSYILCHDDGLPRRRPATQQEVRATP